MARPKKNTSATVAVKATNLAYPRSIAPSMGIMEAFSSTGDSNKLFPIPLKSHTGRGAFLNHPNGKDFDPSKPNVVKGDRAFLPNDTDSLKVTFTLNITPGSTKPVACNIADVAQTLGDIATGYFGIGGDRYLAARYVWRLLSGAFLWRNSTISYDQRIIVTGVHGATGKWTAECAGLNTGRFPGVKALEAACPKVNALIAAVAAGLSTDLVVLHVVSTATVGFGQEVYPSQVFSENGEKDKKLVSTPHHSGVDTAAINSEKIGNALRWIDEWHGNQDFPAVSVEAYGFVQNSLEALRWQTNARHFYDLLWNHGATFLNDLEAASDAETLSNQDIHYFVAMLIRGGVFGAESAKKAKGANGGGADTDDDESSEGGE